MQPLRDRRVMLLYGSELPPAQAWSGTVAGLARAMTGLGAEVHLANSEPGGALLPAVKAWTRARRTWRQHAEELVRLRSLTARVRSRSAPPCDLVVQMGTEFGTPQPGRVVTLEDITVAQAERLSRLHEHLSPQVMARWRERQAEIYSKAACCAVSSRWAAGSIAEDYGVEPERIAVVGFGRNIDPGPEAPARDPSVPRYLWIGLEWERKNGALVVDAFAEVRRAHPAAELHLVGEHPPVGAPGVTGHGRIDRTSPAGLAALRSLLNRATCLVLPSDHEPFGIVHVEALAFGVPSIGTAVGGARQGIGDAGEVVVPRDRDALVAAMLRMADPGNAVELSERAHRRAELFTWTAVAGRIVRAARIPGVPVDGLPELL